MLDASDAYYETSIVSALNALTQPLLPSWQPQLQTSKLNKPPVWSPVSAPDLNFVSKKQNKQNKNKQKNGKELKSSQLRATFTVLILSTTTLLFLKENSD